MSNIVDDKMNGISIVVPFLNEEDGINLFCSTLDDYAKKNPRPIEMIFVNDGSTDRSCELLNQYDFQNIEKVKLISFSKNFGSHAAIRAGIANATYDICTWLGSDLQEPLEFIEMAIAKIQEGYDTVYVEKETVKVSVFNRAFSKTYSALIRKYAVKNYSSNGVGNIVFNRKLIDFLNNNPESNSSIMLQIMDAGFKSTSISLRYMERSAGVSKWTLGKKIKLFIDSFVAFSFMPIRLVSIIGIILFLFGIVYGLWIIFARLFLSNISLQGYASLVCLISVGFGITNISLGIIAEYLWRTFDAARKRPIYIISQIDEMK